MQATLTKWGNSKGIRIPAEICDELGLEAGSEAEVTVDLSRRSVVLTFKGDSAAYGRTKKMSMREFASGWAGGKVGQEWTRDTGAEVVE